MVSLSVWVTFPPVYPPAGLPYKISNINQCLFNSVSEVRVTHDSQVFLLVSYKMLAGCLHTGHLHTSNLLTGHDRCQVRIRRPVFKVSTTVGTAVPPMAYFQLSRIYLRCIIRHSRSTHGSTCDDRQGVGDTGILELLAHRNTSIVC